MGRRSGKRAGREGSTMVGKANGYQRFSTVERPCVYDGKNYRTLAQIQLKVAGATDNEAKITVKMSVNGAPIGDIPVRL